jgi:Na+-driven multidrug efflux pump
MTMLIGVCRAGGDTVFCTIYDLGFQWIIALPLSAVAAFVFHAPPHIIYICLIIEEPLKAILGLWRLKTGKWLHNIVN